MIYENGAVSRILTEEGYITFAGTTPAYLYYLKDHQGNNRVVIDNNGTVEQVNHYYPFGGLFGDNTGGDVQPYKYNGKELDRMHGLDLFDYGARHYDAAIGRWDTVDPLAEKYYSVSPYVYCANNPINYIDPDGKDWYWDKDKTRQYDPNITSQKQLQKGQTYIGTTDVVKDKNGSITENYRKDGSIMFANEASGYDRIWKNTIREGGKEEMGVITDNGVLVLPSYDNTEGNAKFEEYGYSSRNGNIVDAVSGNELNTIALVHTHPGGGAPSGFNGDGSFASRHIPYKPSYVLQRKESGKHSVSYIIAAPNPSRKSSGYKASMHSVTFYHPQITVDNLINNRESLRKHTKVYLPSMKNKIPK